MKQFGIYTPLNWRFCCAVPFYLVALPFALLAFGAGLIATRIHGLSFVEDTPAGEDCRNGRHVRQ